MMTDMIVSMDEANTFPFCHIISNAWVVVISLRSVLAPLHPQEQGSVMPPFRFFGSCPVSSLILTASTEHRAGFCRFGVVLSGLFFCLFGAPRRVRVCVLTIAPDGVIDLSSLA